jgi:hypothetical protein
MPVAAASGGSVARGFLNLIHVTAQRMLGRQRVQDQLGIGTAALKAGTGDFGRRSTIDRPLIARTIRYAIGVYCKERQRQNAEDTLRKLWRAVEQSADLVIITDRTGSD